MNKNEFVKSFESVLRNASDECLKEQYGDKEE